MDKRVRRGFPLMSECVPRSNGGQHNSPVAEHIWLRKICQIQVAPHKKPWFRLSGSSLSFGRTALYSSKQQDADIHTTERALSALTLAEEEWFVWKPRGSIIRLHLVTNCGESRPLFPLCEFKHWGFGFDIFMCFLSSGHILFFSDVSGGSLMC